MIPPSASRVILVDASTIIPPVLEMVVPPMIRLPPVVTVPPVSTFAPVNVSAVVEPDLTIRLPEEFVNVPYCVPASFSRTSAPFASRTTSPVVDLTVRSPFASMVEPVILISPISAESTSRSSMYAVPSTYKSFHCWPEEPRSNVLSVFGIIFELTSP